MAGTSSGEYIQIIAMLVDKLEPADDRDGIAAVAAASAASYATNVGNPGWKRWFEAITAKSVRRADGKSFAKLAATFPGATLRVVGEAKALAFTPMPNDKLPKLLARLQVSGTTLPRLQSVPTSDAGHVEVWLNADLEMTTGKAAAQAAHAFFEWTRLGMLPAAEFPRVRFRAGQDLEQVRDQVGAVAIVDAGRTEIAPGSLTSVALAAGSTPDADRAKDEQ
ncbi:hypothetical protein [Frondihabitans sp. 762G35]|uniref:hypothetical protein n=1 Tax=Frondihabitans sp. 762G35 TaxID=1446794 RepID=UPI000F50C483|nr:hypothetical protein [Frondihabitans sp. 762G35]